MDAHVVDGLLLSDMQSSVTRFIDKMIRITEVLK